MIRGYSSAMSALFSWVAFQSRAFTRARTLLAGVVNVALLCAAMFAAPAFAQTVSSTVSPGSFTAAGDVLTFTFSVDTNGSPISGVSFSGVPGPFQAGSNCSALTSSGSCTARYVITADDVMLGGVQVSLGFTMARSSSGSWSGAVSSSTSWIARAGIPGAPGNVTAVARPRAAVVSFTPSADNGGGTVTYAVSALPLDGGAVGAGQGSGSPITVSGLSSNKRYEFYMNASNAAGGSLSSPVSNTITVLPAPPVLSSLSVTSGPAVGGTPVVLTGMYFSDASEVRFGSVRAATFTATSDSRIAVTAPAGTGTVDITVTNADGTSAVTSSSKYTYVPAPAVTSIAPTAGPTAGGTPVIITGTNLTAATRVNFGAAAATAFTVNSATQITATAPAGAAGTVDVTVTTAGGTSATSAADQYTYVAVPTVTSISPNSGPGTGGTAVTITGTNLTGTTAVNFGAAAATGFTVNSATQITATAPAGATGTVDVTVTSAGGTSAISAADRYSYAPAPTVTSITPNAGPATGGTMVTLIGTNFGGASAVTFGGTAATAFTVLSATTLTATAPAGSGTVDVRVTTVGGTSATSAADQYTYLPVPTVTMITPSAGPTIGGTIVVITGSNFIGTTAVTFGSTAATGFTVNSATSITATAPAGSGTVDVRVSSTGGTSATSAAGQYSYVPAPTVTSISPSVGPSSGGTTVIISGTNLGSATAVGFGATAATGYTIISNTQITATAPAGTGTVDVRVTTPGGNSATSAADQYTYVPAPTVTSISPNSGPVTGGTTVTITGTNLMGTTAVKFGAAAATGFTVNSATQITATAPAGGAGTVDVQVTSLGGSSATSGADQFTYLLAPTVSAITRIGSDPSNASTLQFEVSFSEAVTGVDASDFALTSTDSASGTPSTVVGAGIHYTVTITGVAGAGTLRLDLNSSGTGITNGAGIAIAGGYTNGQTYTVDTINPVVLGVAVPAAGHYLAGSALDFTVSFSKPVVVTGAPRLPLVIGSSTVYASYRAGSGSSALSFSYPVAVGDGDTDGIAVANALEINGGALTDTTGNDALLMLNAVGSTSAVLVGQNPQTLDFSAQPGQSFVANGTFALKPATASSGLAVSYSVAPQAATVCAINGTTVTMLTAGNCVIAADQAGDAYWLAAPQQTQSIAIGQLSQVITGFVANPATPVFSPAGVFSVAAVGGASGEAVVFASTSPTVCAVNGSSVTMLSAGNCALTADQAGNTNYSAAAQVQLNVAINVATQAITAFAANPSAPVFVPNGTFSVSAAGSVSGEPVVFASTTPSLCTVNGSTVTMRMAGNCMLTANQAGNDRYAPAAQQTLSVVISQAAQVISGFTANPVAPVFVANGSFSVAATGGDSGEPLLFASSSPLVCTVNGSTVTMLAAGECMLSADQAGNASYSAAAQQNLRVVIGAAAQVITRFVANPAAPVFTPNGNFSVSATGGDSGAPVVFNATSPNVCTVAGSNVTMLSAGACALTANQAGNANYSAATQVTLDVQIGKATPALAWVANMRRLRSEGSFDLPDPSSNAPGEFTFVSSNTQVATISGRSVSVVGAGVTTLTATLAESGNFVAATVSLELTVDDRPDPSRDASVAAGVQAQLDASLRFVQAQQDNIRGRMGQLRQGRNASSNGMSLNMQGGINQPGLSLRADQVGATVPRLPAGWGVWSAGAIIQGERDARGVSEGFKFRSDGVSFGVDRVVGETLVLGAAGGMGWNDTDFDTGGSSLEAKQQSFALYGVWHSHSWFVDSLLGWGQLDFDNKRHSSVANAMATGSRDGDQRFASLTLGYDHTGDAGTLTGYGRLDASKTILDAYREQGLGIYDLQYAQQNVDSSAAAVGVEGRYNFRTAKAMLRPSWLLEWRQALRSNGDAEMNYVVAPRDSNYVLGLRSYNDDLLAVGAGLDVDFSNGWSMSFLFRREQARDAFANSFGLRIGYGRALAPINAEQAWFQNSGLTRPVVEPGRAPAKPDGR